MIAPQTLIHSCSVLKRLGPVWLMLMLAAALPLFAQTALPTSGAQQIQSLLEEKATWTPAQQKLDSHLHYSAKMVQGQAITASVPSLPTSLSSLERNAAGLVHVDIKGIVNGALLSAITGAGGTVEGSWPRYDSIRAWIPLASAEVLAGRSDVNFIGLAARAMHSSGRPMPRQAREAAVRERLAKALAALAPGQDLWSRMGLGFLLPFSPFSPFVGIDTLGPKAHGVNNVPSYTGAGVKIGVLSDGVQTLATEEGLGNLPTVTVLAGQAGPADAGEGVAMLEIVYSMAPGAQLYFATADISEAQFATNIEALQTAGCKIIVDDVTYGDEPVFQDGMVAQAINTVTAAGALYFSSAANSGNLDSGTSGTWEGDFVNGGAVGSPITGYHGETGTLHNFGGGQTYDSLTQKSGEQAYLLQWSDPFPVAPVTTGSSNDYDLFILNSTGTTVVGASTTRQSGTQPPLEGLVGVIPDGDMPAQMVIVNYQGTAATRTLHLDTERGELSIGTAGATFGHNAGASTISVAATSVSNAGGGEFLGGAQDPPEYYSSDGPRLIYYDASGNAITPGKFTIASGGGKVLSKVDMTAADGTPGTYYNPFYGTSAAAPHAASIAALIWSADPSMTPAQIENVMKTTALPVTGVYHPRTFGAGIAMADASINALPTVVSYNVICGTGCSYNMIGSSRVHLPWQITGVQVVFSHPITSANINSLTGVTASGFSGLGTTTLTWTFTGVTNGNLSTALATTGGNAISSALAPLTGSNTSFALKILQGDMSDDGVVNASDLVLVNNARSQAYNIFADINGDGVVNTADVLVVHNQLGQSNH
jgi:subtilisin family serine protease